MDEEASRKKDGAARVIGSINTHIEREKERRELVVLQEATTIFLTMGRSCSNHSTPKKSPGSTSTARTISTSDHDDSTARRRPPSRTASGGNGLRRPPQRSRSENVNIRRSQQDFGKKAPPRGRSFSPVGTIGRRGTAPIQPHRGRSSSMDRNRNGRGPLRSRSGHSRSGHSRGPPMGHSGHGRAPPMRRSGHSRGPPVNRSGHSRSGHPMENRSGHSRSGHTTILNSRHSRNGDFDRSTRSGHSRTSMGSRPSLADQRRGRNRGSRMYQSLRNATKRQFPWSKFCSYLLPVIVLLAASIGLLAATGNNKDSDVETSPDTDRVVQSPTVNDPFDGGTSPPQWSSDGQGLNVRVVNALDKEWDEVLGQVTEDWEYGNPDAISISIEIAATANDCTATNGAIKICNGDFGATKWRGLTEFELDGSGRFAGVIVKMNDFYLKQMTYKARQYTLCHEIGHSLGLSHLDEDFFNVDLGSCMEYTNDIATSRHPNQSNYEMLLKMYGGKSSTPQATH